MTHCLFSFTETRNRCYRSAFTGSGLRSTITDLKDGTVMHYWAPKAPTEAKPNLLLIHGLGANALWQWGDFVRGLASLFNVYVPDLVFFGGSYTTRPERSERFQAECVMRVMEAQGVRRVSVAGLSYGGFVAYCMAAMERETVVVEKVVVCGSGVCMEERDVKEGLFPVTDLDEAASILVPQTPNKLKELVRYSFFKPTLFSWFPSCFLHDFIENSLDLDCRHLGDNAQLVVIKKAGHAFCAEKANEFFSIFKSYLLDFQRCRSNPKSNRCSTSRASRVVLNASPSSAASKTCRRTQKLQTPLMHEASTAIQEDHLRLLQCLATESSVIEKTSTMPTFFTCKFQNQQNPNSSKP
ncbi:uncharacterized protein HKW66_Vig0177190 [Vigna angularis]|uniref:AB hydrolase-1 domain-containing protein n=1 Tax=Phaseolus angularis TaxID=3914 RepID=A0A8T0JXT2_PHAAN|nr:uncharacterized protein HKW66_Vig0177190 [Vigna angularis]